MKLSANAGTSICEHLNGGEHVAKREHLYLWRSERRLHGARVGLSANIVFVAGI
jgi:hypothetical protein